MVPLKEHLLLSHDSGFISKFIEVVGGGGGGVVSSRCSRGEQSVHRYQNILL